MSLMACMRKLLVILNAMLSAQLLRGGSGWIPALVFTGGRLCAGITGGGLDDREGRRLGSPLRGKGWRGMMLEGGGRPQETPLRGRLVERLNVTGDD